jgi:hypothetical protein
VARTGRPKININWTEAEKLCALQCSEQEIADWFHISVDTLDRRLRLEKQMTFSVFFALHRTAGKIALRRNLYKLSEKQGHVAIFLAKNWLGMKDPVEVTGDQERPVYLIYEQVPAVSKPAS